MGKIKVIKEQNISKDCIVCGNSNDLGLKCRFFELENGELAGIVTAKEQHQSYPGRVHGGILGALLDETMGRAINITEGEVWGVTGEMSVKYKKPVPYGQPLVIIGRITLNKGRLFCGEGEILLPTGEVAATATAKYIKQRLDVITGETDLGWVVNTQPVPEFIVIPEKE